MEQPDLYFEIAGLVTKYLNGELSADEAERLNTWISENDEHRRVWDRLTDPVYLDEHVRYWHGKDPGIRWERQKRAITGKHVRGKKPFRKVMRYAAVLLPLILVCSGWYFFHQKTKGSSGEGAGDLAEVHASIMPRGKVAQLVLANGKVINLNDSLREAITEKDGTQVHNGASALSYLSGASYRKTAVYNTLMTPRGGEYQVRLSDGTKVWLNAASSLRYPTRFTGKVRKVFLSGEAYFEVAEDERHPFVVDAGNTNVTVLGTKFNISSYTNDPGQKITLAEGSVLVNEKRNDKNKGVVLKPGFEAVIRNNENNVRVNKANVEAALAWKNGMFIFDSESLGSLMRKLSRWYNVDVKYDDGVDTLFHFTGRIRRYEDIAGILHLIELTGKVKFSLRQHEIEISPK